MLVWAGQMIGVSFGAPTEFRAMGSIYEEPIAWTRESVANSLGQDDVYVDLSFLEALDKYGLDITYAQAGQAFADTKFGLCHANLDGAYAVMGLLYGKGDLQKTMEIACRCGQDSDCNPASAAGILCTALGYKAIPDEYKEGIPDIADKQFAFVKYTFNTLVPACERFARENIRRSGGKTETIGGAEVFCVR